MVVDRQHDEAGLDLAGTDRRGGLGGVLAHEPHALRHIDASLTSLLLCTFPALVGVGAVALGRERFGVWKATALVVASAGTALVLLGGGSGDLHATGVVLGLGAGIAYSVYILIADGVVRRIDPRLFCALIATGAATALVTTGIVSGSLGLQRVGASTASIASTVEPVLTVSLAVALLGESLGVAQVLGAALVLAAVAALQSPSALTTRPTSVAGDGASPPAPAAAPARTPAREAA